jgi:hypothetical protein
VIAEQRWSATAAPRINAAGRDVWSASAPAWARPRTITSSPRVFTSPMLMLISDTSVRRSTRGCRCAAVIDQPGPRASRTKNFNTASGPPGLFLSAVAPSTHAVLSATTCCASQACLQVAVATRDYREAAILQSIMQAFGKRPCSGDDALGRLKEATLQAESSTVAEMAVAFLQQGFAVIPGAISAAHLPGIQAAWQRKQAQIEPLWRELVDTGASINPRGWPGRFESRVSARAFDMPTSDFFDGADGRTLMVRGM